MSNKGLGWTLLNPFSWFDSSTDPFFKSTDQKLCDWGASSFCVFKSPTSPTFTAPASALTPPYVVSQTDVVTQMQTDWTNWKATAISSPQTEDTQSNLIWYALGIAGLILIVRR